MTNEYSISRCLNNWQTNGCLVLHPGFNQSMFSPFFKLVQTLMTFYCFVHLIPLLKMRSTVKTIQKYFLRKNLHLTCLYLYHFRNVLQLKNRNNKTHSLESTWKKLSFLFSVQRNPVRNESWIREDLSLSAHVHGLLVTCLTLSTCYS